jgi:hypothetical protein
MARHSAPGGRRAEGGQSSQSPTITQPKSRPMTQDPNRQNELKKMELCDSCAGIQRNWRRAPGHPELVQGDNRQEKRGNHLVTITKYRCDRCGTAWEYENDKSNLKAGWSVVGR